MSITGLCQVCEREEAARQCPRCGTLVCETHWNGETELCVTCASETGRGGDEDGPTFS